MKAAEYIVLSAPTRRAAVVQFNVNGWRSIMKSMGTILISSFLLLSAGKVFAQAPPPPPPPPPGGPDEYNVLVLVDVSGSMADPHTASTTKLQQALVPAKNDVLRAKAKAGSKPYEIALWAFDASFPESEGWISRVVDFPNPSDANAVLAQLGFDANGNPSGSPNPVFTPTSSTPLAGAACFAGTAFVASLNASGGVNTPGYEWNKTISDGMGGMRRANIERDLFIETDGLENATPDDGTDDCYGTTSTQAYASYEPESWQYKVRNKLLTGNSSTFSTLDSELVVNVNLIFQNFVSGLAKSGSESRSYSAWSTPYTTEPTLDQAITFYGGVANNTSGSFKTVTVSANGSVDSRRPGDVDYSGCVGNADYSEMMQWYGMQVSAAQPHSYWADLNGDGFVDFLDYSILAAHWGEGGVC
jgi:hypothetical protein